MLSSINLYREYLKENREEYGQIGIGVAIPKEIYGKVTVYGLFDDKIIMSDSNSIYVLKEKSKIKILLKLPFFTRTLKINNAKIWYYDIKKSINEEALLNLKSNELLNTAQQRFYEAFLDKNKQEFYDYQEQVLIGKTQDREAYIYTKKHFK